MNNTLSYPAWIDLHLHLDGSVPLSTARRLADMQAIPAPVSEQEFKQLMSVRKDCKNLNDYLDRFAFPCSLLHTPEAIRQSMSDLLQELQRQGLRYAEIRFAPQKSCEQGMSQMEVVQAALQAMQDSPIPCGLILSMIRGADNHAQNKETIAVAKALHGKGVVAVDLAGAEALFPTHTFREEFALVREAGVPLIIHAGEADGAESVREAIEAGAVRIGHGVRALEDPTVVEMLVNRGVTLELCPTSNLQTGIFASYEDYPLRRLMEAGVRVCLNTDNMTVSDTTLATEWQYMIDTQHLTQDEIQRIIHNTIDATFASEETKAALHQLV